MGVAAPSSVGVPVAPGCCRLTTFTWGGAEVETRTRLGLGDDRVYVRLPASSPAVERIWNTTTVRVLPCTPGGRPIGPPVDGAARVLSEDEDGPARRALGGRRPVEAPPRGDDVLYVEIVPR